MDYSSWNLTELWYEEIYLLAYNIRTHDPEAWYYFRKCQIDPNAVVKTLDMFGALRNLQDTLYKVYQEGFNDDVIEKNIKNLASVIDRSTPIVYGFPYYG